MAAKRTRRRGTSPAQRAYLQSAAAKVQRALALKEAHRALAGLPRCGARAKTTGEPCRKVALANGRCAMHGGTTPAGRDWHKPQVANSSRSVEKAERKLRDQARRKTAREKRLAAMTPEERERHAQWQATHKPGPRSGRENARYDRDARNRFANSTTAPEPLSDEAVALESAIGELKARLARLQAQQAAETTLAEEDNHDE